MAGDAQARYPGLGCETGVECTALIAYLFIGERNTHEISPVEIGETEVLFTMLDGEEISRAAHFDSSSEGPTHFHI